MIKAYVITLSVLTFITYLLYDYDHAVAVGKWRHCNRPRIPEYILLTLTAFGGAFGGWCAMTVQRHKTGKDNKHFRFVVHLSMIMNLIALVIMIVAEL